VTTSVQPLAPPTRHGLLAEARHVVLPTGIVSSGFPAAEATCRKLGLFFDQWQADLNRCILAKDAAGLYAADTVVISIPRQVGKTWDIGALVFADSIINPGTTTIWTAHRFKVARETFNELRGIATSPALLPHIDPNAIHTAAGNESITFRNGSRIVFAARERGAIRGFTKVRRLVLDEGQILTDAALADLAPTMNQAENPQIIIMGTPPKPNDPGEVFTRIRTEALAGESEGALYVEFSAPENADPNDESSVRIANPSYPRRTGRKAIERLRRLLSAEDFMREALGVWDREDSGAAIDPALWSSLADPSAERGPEPVFAVSTAPDRSWAAVAVAWRRPDGSPQVMLADYRPTTTWVQARVDELRARWRSPVLTDTASRGLVTDAAEPSQAEQAQAHNALSDAVLAGAIHHGNEPAMNTAVRAARWKTSGDTRVLDRKGSTDISPLVAAALAVHGLSAARPSVYEDRGLITL
jgi:phage terminase large subunit-like protein